ncbi:MAG: hypothetical protein IKS10_07435 [Lachnospiraceae bacterium]|nr:hypothetical protein [Lachnospiraceae bacterium]
MKKMKMAVALSALMLTALCGCGRGLEDGQKRMDQIANGETTVPVVAPQTVAQTKEAKTTKAEQTSLNFDAEEKLLENVTVESFEPQVIPTATTFEGEEVDLTKMSSTVVYAQVLDILSYPDNYLGKKITMSGLFGIYESPTTGEIYYSCIIQDATACCANGIEFLRKGEFKYPEDYPEPGDEVRVVGYFETYEEDGELYARLRDATMEVLSQNN